MRRDLLIINPASRARVYQSLGQELTAVENPIWAGLLATYARRCGLSVQMVDAEAEELSHAQILDRVRDENPVLIAVVVYGHQPSASTQNMTAAGELCAKLKAECPASKILMMGGHVAALPKRTLEEEAVDFVAVGEGLQTTIALVEALKGVGADLGQVPGLGRRVGSEVVFTPDAPQQKDLGRELPGQPWDLLPMPRYRAHNWHCLGGNDRQPYAALYTTLGCPYRCSFCCIQAPFRSGEKAAGIREGVNSYRYWDPEIVLDEIDVLVNQYGVRNLKIADEMFVLSRKHVLAICEGLIRRKYHLNIWAYTRVDTVKDGMLEKLRAAGFTWLALGIEAGQARVRAEVDKPFEQDQVFEVVADIRKAGINVIGNYIFGLPEDDLDSMQATLDLATELQCEFANFYSAMAYPGSPLYAQALRAGVPLPRSWSGYSQHSRDCLPLPTYHVSAREVLRFRDEAFQSYYANPDYLRMMETRFGSAVGSHLQEMTKKALHRDLLMGEMDVPATRWPKMNERRPLGSGLMATTS